VDIVELHLPCVVPLFRALHTYHAELAPGTYHCDGTDADYLAILNDARAKGARVFAHDAGWGLVSYVLVRLDVCEQDALRRSFRFVRVDHLYVLPAARGLNLGKQLISRVEDWVQEIGFQGWYVTYHSDNSRAAEFYAAHGAKSWKGVSQKRLT
jgi:GNAT superfamily N-acetyltransferase